MCSTRPGSPRPLSGRRPDDALTWVSSLDRRLAAIERWMGLRPDLDDLDQEIARARREKEAARRRRRRLDEWLTQIEHSITPSMAQKWLARASRPSESKLQHSFGGRTAMSENIETAILAGGCFWPAQELLRHRAGVISPVALSPKLSHAISSPRLACG